MFATRQIGSRLAACLFIALLSATAASAQNTLEPPKEFKAEAASSSSIQLTWKEVEGATGYRLLKENGGLIVNLLGADTLSYEVTGLKSGEECGFKIQAFSDEAESSISDVKKAKTKKEAPKPPANVKIKAVSDSKIEVSWDKYDGDDVSFQIERTKGDAEPGEPFTVPAGEQKYVDEGLEKQTKYSYRVRAVTTQPSDWSPKKATSAMTGPPNKPILAGVALSDSQIKLTWTPEPGAAQVITRSQVKGEEGKAIPKNPGDKEHVDAGLDKSTDYFYKLQVERAGGNAESDYLKVRTQDVDFFFRPNPEEVVDSYDPTKVNNKVTCTVGGQWCEPHAAVYVTGWEASTIDLDGLPPTLYKIKVDAGGEYLTYDGSKNDECGGPARGTLGCMVMEFNEPRTRVLIDLFRNRWARPAYMPSFWATPTKKKNYLASLRQPSPQSQETSVKGIKGVGGDCQDVSVGESENVVQSLGCAPDKGGRPFVVVAPKHSTSVAITIFWKEASDNLINPDLCRKKDGQTEWECSMTLPPVDLVFQTWWIELGGFYAFFKLTDEEVVSQAIPATSDDDEPMVNVLRIASGSERDSATGVMSTFFPANYPWLGISFGLTENSGRPLSYFLGPSIRLLGRRSRAAATFTVGYSWIPVRRFPGLDRQSLAEAMNDADKMYKLSADSPLLDGEVEYQDDWFLAVTLGFALERRSTTGSQ